MNSVDHPLEARKKGIPHFNVGHMMHNILIYVQGP